MKSQVRSLNVSPQPTKLQDSKQYINFMKFRHQNLIKMHIEEPVSELEPETSKKRKPQLIYANRGISHWKKYKAQSRSSFREVPMKLEMKEKMKGRIKVQIQNMLKANTISFDKIFNKAQEIQVPKGKNQNQSVCVVGCSLNSLRTTLQIAHGRSKPMPTIKLKEVKPLALTEAGQSTPRNVQTSFDRHYSSKGSPRLQEIQRRKAQSGRNSTSSGIRLKSTINRKSSERGFHKKIEVIKEDEVKPWVIPQFFEEEIIF